MELRPSSVEKATAAKAIFTDLNALHDCDFLLSIGDGKNDEALFSLLSQPWHITVTVGKKRSDAHFYVDSVKDVEMLLMDMINTI